VNKKNSLSQEGQLGLASVQKGITTQVECLSVCLSELSGEGSKQVVEKKTKRTRPNCIKAQRFHQGLPAVPSGLVA